MKMNKKLIATSMSMILAFSLTGCVDQNANEGEYPNTKNAKIATTSTAIVEICEKMDIDLVGVPESDIKQTPKRYEDATKIGMAMAPDMEIVSQLRPDWILSPVTLISDLQPKYEAAKLNYAFMNLKSTEGMFTSIKELGDLFHKEAEADVLVKEYEQTINEFKERNKDKKSPKVLLLMGLPGSYVVATKNSYAGSLLELVGGENVYEDESAEFLNVNPEDMLKKDPDMILLTAHAMPDDVMAMFDEEFKTNDIWKHFDAVKNNQVHQLPPAYFGMSATFDYPKALKHLEGILYE